MRPAIWRWTKRGLIATAVLVALLSIAFFSSVILQRHYSAQFNRTYEQPLKIDPTSPVLEDAHRLLSILEPASSKNSLRFAVMPSFRERWFSISLSEIADKGVGQVVVVRPDGSLISTRNFELSSQELNQFFDIWDAISDEYPGEGRSLFDGTQLAFERRRERRFTSGVGNSPCHYDILGDWAAQRLSPFVPELSDLRAPMAAQLLKTDSCDGSIFNL